MVHSQQVFYVLSFKLDGKKVSKLGTCHAVFGRNANYGYLRSSAMAVHLMEAAMVCTAILLLQQTYEVSQKTSELRIDTLKATLFGLQKSLKITTNRVQLLWFPRWELKNELKKRLLKRWKTRDFLDCEKNTGYQAGCQSGCQNFDTCVRNNFAFWQLNFIPFL